MTMNVTFKRPSLELAFDVGSLKELAGYIQDEGGELSRIFGDDMELVVKAVAGDTSEGGEATPATETAAPKKRGPKPKNQPDPSTATAPPPLAVPPQAAPPVAPSLAIPTDGGIPEFLRNQAPPPPPAPPAPPIAAAVPPSGILAGKVIANLDQRKAATPDAGKDLADWLAQCGLTQAGASYDEAIAVVRMTADDKLSAIAAQLGVA